MQHTINSKVIGQSKDPKFVNMFEEKAARQAVQDITNKPGRPTQDFVLLEAKETDFLEHKDASNRIHRELDTMVFKIISCGMEVKDKRLKEGVFVQVSPSARMITLQWGTLRNILIREFEIVYIFDTNPQDEYDKQVEKVKSDNLAKLVPTSSGGNA